MALDQSTTPSLLERVDSAELSRLNISPAEKAAAACAKDITAEIVIPAKKLAGVKVEDYEEGQAAGLLGQGTVRMKLKRKDFRFRFHPSDDAAVTHFANLMHILKAALHE